VSTTVLGRLRAGSGGSRTVLLTNALSLASGTAITSVLGAVYWWVAARQASQETVGLASAAISTMTLVATLCSLGLATHLMGELPRAKHRARAMLDHALAATALLAAASGLLVAVVAAQASDELSLLARDVPSTSLFALGVVVTSVSFVLNGALVGLLRSGLQLANSVVFGVGKLLVLVGLAVAAGSIGAMALYGTWVAGGLLALALVGPLARRAAPRGGSRDGTWFSAVRGAFRGTRDHQILNLALRLPILLLPVIVVAGDSAESNARFYIAWLIVNFAYVLPGALATVLYAVTAADPAALADKLSLSLRIGAVVTVAAMAVMLVAAQPLLRVFGDDYADAAGVLQLLALSGLPVLVKNHFVNVRRAQDRVRAALPLVWGGSALEVALAALGAWMGGAQGLCVGWLLAVVFEMFFMAPAVVSALRPKQA